MVAIKTYDERFVKVWIKIPDHSPSTWANKKADLFT